LADEDKCFSVTAKLPLETPVTPSSAKDMVKHEQDLLELSRAWREDDDEEEDEEDEEEDEDDDEDEDDEGQFSLSRLWNCGLDGDLAGFKVEVAAANPIFMFMFIPCIFQAIYEPSRCEKRILC